MESAELQKRRSNVSGPSSNGRGNTFATRIHPGFFVYCLEDTRSMSARNDRFKQRSRQPDKLPPVSSPKVRFSPEYTGGRREPRFSDSGLLRRAIGRPSSLHRGPRRPVYPSSKLHHMSSTEAICLATAADSGADRLLMTDRSLSQVVISGIRFIARMDANLF